MALATLLLSHLYVCFFISAEVYLGGESNVLLHSELPVLGTDWHTIGAW